MSNSWNGFAGETAWMTAWEHTARHTHWVERNGKFYPMGTRVEQMNGRTEPLPAGWARLPGRRPLLVRAPLAKARP